jgi:cbb3-type cytochrome oxidase subunit 3
MLREFLSNVTLLDLPIIGMSIFMLLFLGVIARVCQRRRSEAYQAMAGLPLNDQSESVRPLGDTREPASMGQGGAR